MTDTHYVVPARENRQLAIESMEVGDAISISRRIHLLMGVPIGTIREHTDQLRGIMDGQTNRARRKLRERRFKVETGSFITQDGALIVTSVCSRVE